MSAWIIGLVFSLGLGHFITKTFLDRLRNWMGILKKSPTARTPHVPDWLTGLVERLFFTVLVAFNVNGFATAMMGWLALKLASNWNHKDMDGRPKARAGALSALLAGVISMLCAYIGGLICASKWALW